MTLPPRSPPNEGNYIKLTRNLDRQIYNLDYKVFQESVEYLIAMMSLPTNANINRFDWRGSLFRVLMALAEGGRFTPVSTSLTESQSLMTPSPIPRQWVYLIVHGWSSFSKSASLKEDKIHKFQTL